MSLDLVDVELLCLCLGLRPHSLGHCVAPLVCWVVPINEQVNVFIFPSLFVVGKVFVYLNMLEVQALVTKLTEDKVSCKLDVSHFMPLTLESLSLRCVKTPKLHDDLTTLTSHELVVPHDLVVTVKLLVIIVLRDSSEIDLEGTLDYLDREASGVAVSRFTDCGHEWAVRTLSLFHRKSLGLNATFSKGFDATLHAQFEEVPGVSAYEVWHSKQVGRRLAIDQELHGHGWEETN